MEIIKRPLGLYKANCYVLKKDNQSLIIDPGFHSKHIIEMVGDSKPIAVLLTHGHCDHVSALDDICGHYNIPAYLHDGDHELLQLIRRRPSVYKKKMFTQCIPLQEGILNIGPFHIRVYHTPGHSAGSVCFEIEGHLFTGDTIFKQNVGNSDNYNGNAEALRKSLCKIMELDDALLVEPGHRESTILRDVCPEAPCTCGNSSAVEHRLAKAGVASSNLVSRSTNFIWRHSQAVRQRSAKPLFPSSILGAASTKSLPMPGWRNRQTQRT